ncbi:MAG: tRNA uridine-5-carboxymethylaminomethyl(34) synthesis GTPase MnmE [Desulfobacteraceae bacterium]|nr:MAG: tRNA uridine-5-carboxymethylaminomethyl(34) synthesis GTPase MnmE [Desulfobacteraceae bacterium]
MENDTIAAISTPIGSGGIGIIKISGKKALPIVSSIFRRSSARDRCNRTIPSNIIKESHKLYHGYIYDPDNGKTLDEVLVSVMLSPHSYTREDVVEINVHSGIVVLRTVLDLIIRNGARLALPGEFTKRAFINGRMDLTQAEAVIDIINVKSRKALEILNTQAAGTLGLCVESILRILNGILVKIEAAIDFPEDVDALNHDSEAEIIENKVIGKLNELIAGYEEGHLFREGIRIAIAGRPNVGKSSLMNRLLKVERSIVTSIPGTTRDAIEETLIISGIPTIISDTAGLHDTTDPVETLGIKKTRELIKNADIILFMTDAFSPLSEADIRIYETIKDKQVVIVINKIDLIPANRDILIGDDFKRLLCVKISALHDIGIEFLKEKIKEIFLDKIDYNSIAIVPNMRQKIAVEKALEKIVLVIRGLKSGFPYEMISIDLGEAIDYLNEVIGKNVKTDILDKIFSQFCIGK